ncbi:MAG: hypothetical protein AAF989_08330 [Planctomycetota bacterium]
MSSERPWQEALDRLRGWVEGKGYELTLSNSSWKRPDAFVEGSHQRWKTVALTGSRIGDCPVRRAGVCERLTRLMLGAKTNQAIPENGPAITRAVSAVSSSFSPHRVVQKTLFVVAEDSAVASHVIRAAELFSVPLVRIRPATGCDRGRPRESSGMPNRDQVLIDGCDDVEALYVRRRGRIHSALAKRLARESKGMIRVAVSSDSQCASAGLIKDGAVGWYIGIRLAAPAEAAWPTASEPFRDWTEGDNWLVHCTRSCVGPWPGQSRQQNLDDWLIGSQIHRDALATLRRILRMQRLVGSAVATAKKYPVVCFSDLSMPELLKRRTYRSHLRRWDYEPYGVAIRRRVAVERGVLPVIYGDRRVFRETKGSDRFRYQANGSTYDWTQEREHRCLGDLNLASIPPDDVRVFVPDRGAAESIRPCCPFPVRLVARILQSAEPPSADFGPREPK